MEVLGWVERGVKAGGVCSSKGQQECEMEGVRVKNTSGQQQTRESWRLGAPWKGMGCVAG